MLYTILVNFGNTLNEYIVYRLHECRKSIEACFENDTQQILALAGMERWRKKEEGWKFRTLGFISLREHIERKKIHIL